ncbi:uncharacterized protein LOC119655030 [Hermetia illucens]|uniref:uncharacterized protein LOC119655030 n=1 Tax=Hermetia illucens TaxID=343691 RepID=UPI0018CC5EED|nr:uncharacterized protein LOC119655030 [Hermetia illucens]
MFFYRDFRMQLYYIVTGLIASIVATGSDTIHYTNSPNHLAPGANYTAYRLEVPGTNGITVIETLDPTDDNPESAQSEPETQGPKKMVYAPDLLNKFIEEYNDKLKNSKDGAVGEEKFQNEEEALDTLENRRVNRLNIHPNRKHQLVNDNPFADKAGWVTLEAVPWSKSKVSRWKPNVDTKTSATMASVSQYNVNPIGPLENSHIYYGGGNDEPQISKYPPKRPNFYSDPHKNDGFYDRNDVQAPARPDRHRPRPLRKKNPGYYNTPEPELEVSSNHDRWYDYGFRPNFDGDERPTPNRYHTSETGNPPRKGFLSGIKLNKHRDEIPNRDDYAPNTFDRYPDSDRDQDHSYVYQERPELTHPATYPSNGNAKETSSNGVPMTTSHGGLLEVDSSRQTIENSVLKSNKKRNKRKNSGENTIQRIEIENGSKPDSTAVLAAVGAGMVPATVAMIMPMLGRRRREIVVDAEGKLPRF